ASQSRHDRAVHSCGYSRLTFPGADNQSGWEPKCGAVACTFPRSRIAGLVHIAGVARGGTGLRVELRRVSSRFDCESPARLSRFACPIAIRIRSALPFPLDRTPSFEERLSTRRQE